LKQKREKGAQSIRILSMRLGQALVVFLAFCQSATVLFGEIVESETFADQRLAEILEAEFKLQEEAVEGAGEESILVRAQEIADRYKNFLAENPDHLYGWILCGKFLRSIGADRRSFASFQKADSLSPDLPVVQRYLGLIAADMGDFRLALPYLLRAVELDPEEPVYRDDLGLFLVRFGPQLEADGALAGGRGPALALQSFEQAFRLDPASFERGWRWAEAYADLPEPDWEATALAWETVFQLSDTIAEREACRLQMARAWIEFGDMDRARQWLDPVQSEVLQHSWQNLKDRAAGGNP